MSQRINHQPVFLLSSTPWRENSLRIEAFSRDHGRLSLLARSARTRGSELRGILMPFVPLSASWYGKEELKTLHRAEWLGGWPQPRGRALFSGLYINELVLKLTAREDPAPTVFAALERIFRHLCTQADHHAELRRFEWALLHTLGLCPDFRHDADQQPIQPQQHYLIRPEAPPQAVPPDHSPSHGLNISGTVLLGLPDAALPDPDSRRQASKLMRMLIDFRLPEIRSRTVLQQLKQLQKPYSP